ncbi:MAG: hypothetical protein ABMB14_34170 [Myxococcota bacterium]
MAVQDQLQQAWADHGTDAERVAATFPDLIDRSDPDEVPAVVGLVVHVLGEHLGRWDDGLAAVDRIGARHGPSEAVDRGAAIFRMCAGDREGAERILDQLGTDRTGNEARILALAAGAVGAHGRTTEATRWLVRAASLVFELADGHPAVRAVGATGNNLAVLLEERKPNGPEEAGLLRSAATLSRVAWERAGTWLEVERAEYRLTMTSLVLSEPYAAVAHAEACLAICEANAADPGERLFAHEAMARARLAIGDRDGAMVSRQRVASLVPTTDAAFGPASVLAKLDRALGTPDPAIAPA